MPQEAGEMFPDDVPSDSPYALPVLHTKLYRPTVPPDALVRNRVISLLDQGSSGPLTLVSAAAGYGKSVAVCQWLDAVSFPSAWVSLDEYDDGVRPLLEYTIAALKQVFPDHPWRSESLLSAAALPAGHVLARYLLADLAQLQQRFVLVLDDFHCVRDAQAHELFSELVRYPADSLNLVLVTRRDPPLPLATMRANGQLVEIGANDLKFTADEAVEFVRQQFGAHADDAEQLNARLEGWPAGMRLAALSLQDSARLAESLLASGSGFVRVTEFLTREVLARLPQAVTNALMESSILDRFNASLWEALLDSDDAESALSGHDFIERIVNEHLFVSGLDGRGEWYRFHQLFQGLLYDQLRLNRTSNQVAGLHLRASAWLERNGHIQEAIRHALAAGEAILAAEIVERNRDWELQNDRWNVIEKWLSLLPEDVVRNRPQLLLTMGWLYFYRYDYEGFAWIIERVESLTAGDAEDAVRSAELNCFRGLLCYMRGEPEASCRALEAALNGPTHVGALVSGELRLFYGLAMHAMGDARRALAYIKSEGRVTAFGSDFFRARILAAEAYLYLVSADSPNAARAADRLIAISEVNPWDYAFAWGSYLQGLSNLQAMRYREASRGFAAAFSKRALVEPRLAADAAAGLALALQLDGDTSATADAAGALREHARLSNDPAVFVLAESLGARLALLRGERATAIAWAENAETAPDAVGMVFWLDDPRLTKLRVQIASESKSAALEALDSLQAIRADAERLNYRGQLIDIMALQSVALAMLDHPEEALRHAKEAVALAAPGTWGRPFVELGAPMGRLLAQVEHDEVPPAFLRAVQRATRRAAEHDSQSRATLGIASLSDALTQREIDVLSLVSQGHTNKAIAARLCISPDAVKKRLYYCFQKLQVRTRTEAVSKANSMGIL